MRNTLILCLVYLVVACTHTVVGGQEYSPGEKYVFIFEMHGASGKAYTEVSDKRVYFFINEKGSNNQLLKSELVIKAGALEAEAVWETEQKLDVNFYEENGDVRKAVKSVSIVKNNRGVFAVE